MRVKKPRIVHHHHRRGRWPELLLLLLVIAALWWVYEFGLRQGGYQRQLAQQEIAGLQHQLQEQQELNSDLRSEAVRYRRQAEIERQASRELQQQLMQLQDRNAALAADVELLQNLISNDAGTLYIKDFRLVQEEQNRYRYHFTLVQVMEKIKHTQGKLLMKLSGKRKGKKQRLDRARFSPDGEKALKLEFSNYADVDGEILLPEGFAPTALQIEFLPRNKGLKKMQKTFPWAPSA